MKDDNIGIIIKELRKQKSMSQQELADKLNTTNFTISKWENNITTPDIYHLKNISKIFNITVDDLMNNRLNKKKPNYTKALLFIVVVQLIIITILSIHNIKGNKIIVNNLFSDNNSISLKGILIANKDFSVIEINDIEYIDKNAGSVLETIPEHVSIVIKSNKDTLISKNIENTDKESIDQLLRKESMIYQDNKKIEDLTLIIKYMKNNKTEQIETKINQKTTTKNIKK